MSFPPLFFGGKTYSRVRTHTLGGTKPVQNQALVPPLRRKWMASKKRKKKSIVQMEYGKGSRIKKFEDLLPTKKQMKGGLK